MVINADDSRDEMAVIYFYKTENVWRVIVSTISDDMVAEDAFQTEWAVSAGDYFSAEDGDFIWGSELLNQPAAKVFVNGDIVGVCPQAQFQIDSVNLEIFAVTTNGK